MAEVRKYGYYIKGNKIAIVEKDTAFDNDANSRDYGPGSNRSQWKSATDSIADGIEIQYVYSPEYFIESTNLVDVSITQYKSTDGYLKIADNSSSYINYATAYSLAADNYIVLKNAGKFNGLHKIKSLSNNTGTNNVITLYTKYSGNSTLWTNFEKTVSLYYAVDVLNDEDDNINLSNYLSKALVYYVKAKISEDMMNLEAKEYFMAQFNKMVEKYNNTRVAGARIIASGSNAII
ncbi:MAG: hypothetical protein Unbinned1966contig1000_49 [Prokaryotic dsDNA virus sp.]|nr:MAG: hypothetical protein Unbinned1966contig1000_49 [Prokaryotic dsDNA virus sp.]|tara:strand:+ start:17740 stop:18444 length:705 start_codon:yes stop_codon:yes gene_type:complete